jgi:hypothetical protein
MIFAIAGEEMLHWAVVQNLLTAAWSPPPASGPHATPGEGLPVRGAASAAAFGDAPRCTCTWSAGRGGAAPTLKASAPTGPPPRAESRRCAAGQDCHGRVICTVLSKRVSLTWRTSGRTGSSAAFQQPDRRGHLRAGLTFGPDHHNWRVPTGPSSIVERGEGDRDTATAHAASF